MRLLPISIRLLGPFGREVHAEVRGDTAANRIRAPISCGRLEGRFLGGGP